MNDTSKTRWLDLKILKGCSEGDLYLTPFTILGFQRFEITCSISRPQDYSDVSGRTGVPDILLRTLRRKTC